MISKGHIINNPNQIKYLDLAKETVTLKIDLGEWKFIELNCFTRQEIHLIHECPLLNLNTADDIKGEKKWYIGGTHITTFAAWHLKLCAYCETIVPDDVHSILHTLLPRACDAL